MITILNGKLTIPESERFIGFAGDNLRRTIEFLLSGVQNADRIYRIYLTFDDGTVNYFVLPSKVTEDGVVLTWQVLKEHIFMSGWVDVQIKAFSDNGVVWHTTTDKFFVGDSAEFSESIKTQNTEFLQYEERLNELSKEVADICVLMPFVGDNGNWYIYDAQKREYIDSGKPSVIKVDNLQLEDGSVTTIKLADESVTSLKLADRSVDRLSLFTYEMINKYLSMPVYTHSVFGDISENFYNSLTNQGIHRVDTLAGLHQVVVVLKPESDAYLMQIKFDYNKIEYRGIWCTEDGVYADDDWENWTLLTLQTDSELNADSENPIQNKAVYSALDRKMSKASNFTLLKKIGDNADPQVLAYQTYEPTTSEMLRIPLSLILEKFKKITDAGEYYVSENIDDALQEIGKSLSNSQPKTITDAGGYYDDKTVEAALQEIGFDLLRGDISSDEFKQEKGYLLANVTENSIFYANKDWTDAPSSNNVGVFINRAYTSANRVQIYISMNYGTIFTRIVNSKDNSIYRDWQNTGFSNSLHSWGDFSEKYERSLAKASSLSGFFCIQRANWDDLPITTCDPVFFNYPYTDNYALQFLTYWKPGYIYYRIVHRKNFSIYQDWKAVCGSPEPMKILAVGDSICRGNRNSNKGFVGDLLLPYTNAGVSGATISNVVTEYKNIPDQLKDVTGFTPDIIIANGGINDYFYDAPLGTLSAVPVTTDEAAEALDRSTLAGGMEYLFYQMIKLYPKAQRFFVITHKTWKTNESMYCPTTKNTQGWTQQDLHDFTVKCCNLYNVKVIDVYNDSVINSLFSEYRSGVSYDTDNSVTNTEYVDYDGVHPLAYGYLEGYIPLIKKAVGIGTVK